MNHVLQMAACYDGNVSTAPQEYKYLLQSSYWCHTLALKSNGSADRTISMEGNNA
jgi:hypothetical protein